MTNWLPDLSRGSGPVYLRLADSIESAISSGALPAGSKLPPQLRTDGAREHAADQDDRAAHRVKISLRLAASAGGIVIVNLGGTPIVEHALIDGWIFLVQIKQIHIRFSEGCTKVREGAIGNGRSGQ